MKKHSLKDWMIAVRPWSFPASSMPVVVTLAYLYWMRQDINWVNGIWALLNIVVFHAAGNTWSDYFDYKHKVDARDTFGAKTLTDGMFAPREIYGLSMALLAVALVAGVGLLWRTGLPLLYIGIGGAACSLLYPPLKYRALGDVVIFLAYALLPTLGTCYVATGVVDWNVLWIALPVGLITVAILHANNDTGYAYRCPCRDSDTGHEAGRKGVDVRLLCRSPFPFWLDSWLDSCGNSSSMDPAGDAGTGSCHRQCTGGVPFSRKGRKCHSRSG